MAYNLQQQKFCIGLKQAKCRTLTFYLQQQKFCIGLKPRSLFDLSYYLQQQKFCIGLKLQMNSILEFNIYNSRNFVLVLNQNELERYCNLQQQKFCIGLKLLSAPVIFFNLQQQKFCIGLKQAYMSRLEEHLQQQKFCIGLKQNILKSNGVIYNSRNFVLVLNFSVRFQTILSTTVEILYWS